MSAQEHRFRPIGGTSEHPGTAEASGEPYPAPSAPDQNIFAAAADPSAESSGPASQHSMRDGPSRFPEPSQTKGPAPTDSRHLLPNPGPRQLSVEIHSRFWREERRIAERLYHADDRIPAGVTRKTRQRTLQKEWAYLSSSFTNRYGFFCNRRKARILFDLHLLTILIGQYPHDKEINRLRGREHTLSQIASTF